MELPETDFLDLILSWLMEGMEAKDVVELERKLTVPPIGTEIDPNDRVWSRDAEMSQGIFASLSASKKSKKVGRASTE